MVLVYPNFEKHLAKNKKNVIELDLLAVVTFVTCITPFGESMKPLDLWVIFFLCFWTYIYPCVLYILEKRLHSERKETPSPRMSSSVPGFKYTPEN